MKKVLRGISLALVLMLVFAMLTGCVGAVDKTKEKLEKKDYTVIAIPTLGLGGVESTLMATKEDEAVLVYYYKESGDAADAVKKAKEDLTTYASTLGKDKGDLKAGKSGKVVYIGTKKAVNNLLWF